MTLADMDPVAWTLQRYEQAPLRMSFRGTDRADAPSWQGRLRTKLTELLGGFPQSRLPLDVTRLSVHEFPGYAREKITFVSRPGVSVLAYVLTPKNVRGVPATVICVPGHGYGVDSIVGIDVNGEDRPGVSTPDEYARQAVERGLAVVALEPVGFGARRGAGALARGQEDACEPVAGAALLLGETMIGWRVWDVMRALDYIETRPDLDASRVGCVGISGGGTCALYAAALDQRIRCTYLSCCLGTFAGSIMAVPHCVDNYVPGILNWAETYDVAGLIAPRALYCESGSQDAHFPVAAAREAFKRIQHIYSVVGAEDRARQEIFEGGHRFHGQGGWDFVLDALGAKP
jgi:dienelactone hydrolase